MIIKIYKFLIILLCSLKQIMNFYKFAMNKSNNKMINLLIQTMNKKNQLISNQKVKNHHHHLLLLLLHNFNKSKLVNNIQKTKIQIY